MIFPTLAGKKFGRIDLNEAAKCWLTEQGINHCAIEFDNPLLDPNICRQMVEEHQHSLDLDYSYGGWLENRSTIWKGSYLDAKRNYLHLGVDFNVPEGTPVATDNDGVILQVDTDNSIGGWGTRIILLTQQPQTFVLIYAHLRPHINLEPDTIIRAGTLLGEVDASDTNGHWYPHLHEQALSREAF